MAEVSLAVGISEGLIGYLADIAMVPVMYLLSGTSESPQRAHRWNNTHLQPSAVEHLEQAKMVHCEGIPDAMRRINPIFHLPLLGGWRDYVVLEPTDYEQKWHVGWISEDDIIGVSRIPLSGPVRMLIGPGAVFFFGVTVEDGTQIALSEIGSGQIGDGGEWAHTPLL